MSAKIIRLRQVQAYALAGVFGVLALTAAAGAESSWRQGPSTREALADAALENDLMYVAGNGQLAPDYYPQVAVVQWGPISAEHPGRYRVHVRARTEKLGTSPLMLQAWVPKESGGVFDITGYGDIPILVAAVSMSGCTFTAPAQWQEFTLEFDVERGKPVMVGAMYLGGTNCAAGKIQIEKATLTLEKVDLPVSVSWARPDKVRYKHAEQGALEVRLVNATAAPQEVQLRPVIVDEDGKATPGTPVKFTVEPAATLSGTVPFAVPAQDGGYEVRVELLQAGKVIDQKGDVFAVSDSPFRCMIQGNVHPPLLLSHAFHLGLQGFREKVMDQWEQYTRDCQVSVEHARREYCTYFEYFAWAREDATMMTEDSDEPYLSGQTLYPVSRKQILLLNGLMKQRGIAPVAYLNAIPFGWPGFEVVRRHPEWYLKAMFNTAVMEKYFNNETVEGNVYPAIEMNFETPSANGGQTYLAYHIEQMIASAKQYGWEAYRYDAGPLRTNYFPTVKAALAKLTPPVGIGNNLGICCLGNQPSAAWTTYCRDGSLMMEENIVCAFDSPTDPHRRWLDWIAYLRTGAHLTRSAGGYYTFINSRGNWLSTALGFAAGGHPWGSFESPYGELKRFMIRYGSFFWDPRTQLLEAPEKALSVTSPRPVWWKPLVSERRLSTDRRQVIVPLFNPPAGEEVVNTACEAPAEGVQVLFTPEKGERVTAWLLSPEPVATRVALPTKTTAEGRLQVTVPRFWGWVNVVFDCEGK
ncbi:MAG: hypothetical protein L6437_13990 [Kiritimatiellae bacterium]|nr:hypothetical protein [Kiritimatiellia bacterium]